MKQYYLVRVAVILGDQFAGKTPCFQRDPQVGDSGTIVEDYGDALEVECCELHSGVTLWLEAMFPNELQKI